MTGSWLSVTHSGNHETEIELASILNTGWSRTDANNGWNLR